MKVCEICEETAANCECEDYGFDAEDTGWGSDEDQD